MNLRPNLGTKSFGLSRLLAAAVRPTFEFYGVSVTS
jgi:hypothetical protein